MVPRATRRRPDRRCRSTCRPCRSRSRALAGRGRGGAARDRPRPGLPEPRDHRERAWSRDADGADRDAARRSRRSAFGSCSTTSAPATRRSSYLTRLPLDALKVDRSFVDGLGSEPRDTAITEAIIAMSRALSLDVVGRGGRDRAAGLRAAPAAAAAWPRASTSPARCRRARSPALLEHGPAWLASARRAAEVPALRIRRGAGPSGDTFASRTRTPRRDRVAQRRRVVGRDHLQRVRGRAPRRRRHAVSHVEPERGALPRRDHEGTRRARGPKKSIVVCVGCVGSGAPRGRGTGCPDSRRCGSRRRGVAQREADLAVTDPALLAEERQRQVARAARRRTRRRGRGWSSSGRRRRWRSCCRCSTCSSSCSGAAGRPCRRRRWWSRGWNRPRRSRTRS